MPKQMALFLFSRDRRSSSPPLPPLHSTLDSDERRFRFRVGNSKLTRALVEDPLAAALDPPYNLQVLIYQHQSQPRPFRWLDGPALRLNNWDVQSTHRPNTTRNLVFRSCLGRALPLRFTLFRSSFASESSQESPGLLYGDFALSRLPLSLVAYSAPPF